MACCIVVAMVISQLIWLWEQARAKLWLNIVAISLAALSVGLVLWHWHHIEELILNPFAFTFVSDLLNQAGSFCRSVVR